MTATEEWAEARRLLADAHGYSAQAARHLRWAKIGFGLVGIGLALQLVAIVLLLVAQ